jgi:hypothetical protein
MRKAVEAVRRVMNSMHQCGPVISEGIWLPLLLIINLGGLDVLPDALLAGHAKTACARGGRGEHRRATR